MSDFIRSWHLTRFLSVKPLCSHWSRRTWLVSGNDPVAIIIKCSKETHLQYVKKWHVIRGGRVKSHCRDALLEDLAYSTFKGRSFTAWSLFCRFRLPGVLWVRRNVNYIRKNFILIYLTHTHTKRWIKLKTINRNMNFLWFFKLHLVLIYWCKISIN